VPGTVEAWGRLIERYGKLGMAAVLEPAAALARDGYIITERLSEFPQAGRGSARTRARREGALTSDGSGDALRNPDLASVLTDIGRAGVGGFYRGAIRCHRLRHQERDGLVTHRTLATPPIAGSTLCPVDYRSLPLRGTAPTGMTRSSRCWPGIGGGQVMSSSGGS